MKPIPVWCPIALVAFLLAAACRMGEPPEPAEGTFEWTTYRNADVGYAVELPDLYRPDEEDGGRAVLFRSGDGVPVKVYWMTESEGDGRGLWFGESPVGVDSLAGFEARRYEYTHCDGPLCSRMVSFVIPHGERMLALEFRSDGPLTRTNERILRSFALAPRA